MWIKPSTKLICKFRSKIIFDPEKAILDFLKQDLESEKYDNLTKNIRSNNSNTLLDSIYSMCESMMDVKESYLFEKTNTIHSCPIEKPLPRFAFIKGQEILLTGVYLNPSNKLENTILEEILELPYKKSVRILSNHTENNKGDYHTGNYKIPIKMYKNRKFIVCPELGVLMQIYK